MKRRIISLLLVLCMLVPMLPTSALGASNSSMPFTDVETAAWYYEPIEYVYSQGLMNGMEDNLFAPRKDLTRAMFVTILGRLDSVDTSNYTSSSFSDVDTGLWYSPYVEWAAENGIVTGYEDGTFAPGKAITREQMSTIIARYVQTKGIMLSVSSYVVSGFNDISSVRAYALEGLELMRTSGIITGDEYGNFNPNKTATRAEAATVFMRLDRAIANSNTSTTTDKNDNDTSSTDTKVSSKPSSSGGVGSGSGGTGNSDINLIIDQGDNITVTNVNFQLTGSFNITYNVESIEYFISAEIDNYNIDENFDFYTGKATINSNKWVIDNLKPKAGNNIITIVAKTNDGKSYEKKINVFYDLGTEYTPSDIHIKYDDDSGYKYVDNVIEISFENNVPENIIMNIINEINGNVVGSHYLINSYYVEIPSRSLTELELLCDQLEDKYPNIIYGAFIYELLANIDTIPNDLWPDDSLTENIVERPNWYGLFNEKDDGALEIASNWGLMAIEAPSAWNYYDSKLINAISVGVVDGGFDISHEDLSGKILLSVMTKKDNFTLDHGTHVAGIIGAWGNNEKGITGVAYNSALYCISLANKNSNEEPDLNIARLDMSLEYAVSVGCKVVNYSLGASTFLSAGKTEFKSSEVKKSSKKYSRIMAELLDKGYDFIVVQAAGNGNDNSTSVNAINNLYYAAITKENISIPLSCKVEKEEILNRIIIVGNARLTYSGTFFQMDDSNFGDQVSICAPGTDIFSTTAGNHYENKTGTSMASPMVAGVCALVWGVDKNWDGAKVRNIVCNNTKDEVVPSSRVKNQTTLNMVNARLAVEAAIREKYGEQAIIKDNASVNGLIYEIISDTEVKVTGVSEVREEYSIPDTITYNGKEYRVVEIGDGVFDFGAEPMAKITHLSKYIVTVGSRAFWYADLSEVELPSTLKNIGSEAFCGASLAKILTLSGTVNISYGAFYYVSNVETLIIDKFFNAGIEDIFICSGDLISITVEQGNLYYKSLDGVLYSSDGATLYIYPPKRLVGNNYIVPDGVHVIKSYAFSGAIIEEVILPTTILRIEAYAINWCDNLKKIIIYSARVQIDPKAIYQSFGRALVIYGYQNSTVESYVSGFNLNPPIWYGLKTITFVPFQTSGIEGMVFEQNSPTNTPVNSDMVITLYDVNNPSVAVMSSTTDGWGIFEIYCAAGTYNVVFSCTGFETHIVSNLVVAANTIVDMGEIVVRRIT